MNKIDLITKRITNGEVEDALNLMINYSRSTNPKIYNQVLILSCQLHNWASQKNLGLNPPEEIFNRIIVSTTYLLKELKEEQIHEISLDNIQLLRITQIEDKIKETFLLIGEWEQKRDLAENPNERKRSILETQKLKSICDEYLEELNNLLFLQKKKIMDLINKNPEKLLEELRLGSIKKSEMEAEVKTKVLVALDYLQEKFLYFRERKEVYKVISQFSCPEALKYLEKYLKLKPSDIFFEDKYWIALYVSEFKNQTAKEIINEALQNEKNEYVKTGLTESLNKLSNHLK